MRRVLQLRLFGPWRADLDGDTIAPATHSARLLLARLALCAPSSVSQATLVADLFPSYPAETARRRLRSARQYLRHCLGSLLVSSDEQLGLDPEIVVVSDYRQFWQKTEHGATLAEIEEAITLYRGPLLAPVSDGWAAAQANLTQARYLEALQRLTLIARAARQPAVLLRAARRWVAEEPWDESSHIALIQALIDLGEIEAAADHLSQARALLRAEWNGPGSPALEEQARTIARLTAARPLTPAPGLPPEKPVALGLAAQDTAPTPLIGRGADMAALDQVWQQALTHRPAGVLVEGAGGVGKTRLVQELAATVRLRSSWMVLWLTGQPGDDYWRMFEQALVSLSEPGRTRVQEVCRDLDDRTWGLLCLMMPRIVQYVPERRPQRVAHPLHFGEENWRGTALFTLIDRLCARWPLLLVLDDPPVDDADIRTTVIRLLAGHRPICVLLTALPGKLSEYEVAPGGSEHLFSLRMHRLEPLDPAATRLLLQETLGDQLEPAAEARVVSLCGGNLEFLLTLTRVLADQGGLQHRPGRGWCLADPDAPLPRTLPEVLALRLRRLTPGALKLATTIAALGRPADDALLEDLTPCAEERVALQAELLTRHVLVERGDSLRFAQRDYPHLLLAMAGPEACAAVHAALALALRERPGLDQCELLEHYERAGMWPETLALALRVADAALYDGRLAALHNALDRADRAIGAMALAPSDERRWRALRLRETLQAHTEPRAVWDQTLDTMLDLAEASGRSEWQIEALVRAGLARMTLAGPTTSEQLLQASIARASAAGLPSAEAQICLALADAFEDQGATGKALDVCCRAADMAVQAQADDLTLRVLMRLAVAYAGLSLTSKAASLIDRLSTNPFIHERPLLGAQLTYTHSLVLLSQGHYIAALASLRAALQQAQHLGDLALELQIHVHLCKTLAYLGMFSESQALCETTLPMARHQGNTRAISSLLLAQAFSVVALGEAAEALALTREGHRMASREGFRSLAADHLGLATRVALDLGRPGEAQELAAQIDALAPGPLPITCAAPIASLWLALGNQRRARAFAVEAAGHTSSSGMNRITLASALWETAEVITALDGPSAAAPMRRRAVDTLLDDLLNLNAPGLRRSFLAARPAHSAIAAAAETHPNRRMVWLALRHVPTGRPLYGDEIQPVVWTLHADDDPAAPIARRRRQIGRLCTQALEQGSVATVENLASALNVTTRTIKRDLRSCRDQGDAIITRGTEWA